MTTFPFVSCVNVAVRIDNAFKRIAAINDHFQSSRLNQLFNEA
jgi:hypothetical protein